MEEVWKDVAGYEGRYMVSNLGRFKSLRYRGHDGEKIMRSTKHHSGYKIIRLGNNPRKIYSVHILVAKAFVENPNGKPYVNHIDGNKENNVYNNLEWVTARENTVHAIYMGLFPESERDPYVASGKYKKKRLLQYDLNGNLLKEWSSCLQAANAYGCNSASLTRCAKGEVKSCSGYNWRYAE